MYVDSRGRSSEVRRFANWDVIISRAGLLVMAVIRGSK